MAWDDYSPVEATDEEEERKRRYPYAPVKGGDSEQAAGKDYPAAPDGYPAVASALPQLALRPQASAPALAPAHQRLTEMSAQGAPPVEPLHGFKKGLDTMGRILTPELEQRLRYGKQDDYARNLAEAQSESRAEDQANPQPKPKEEEWSVVAGMTGPKGELVQQEKTSGQMRFAPDLAGVHATDKPGSSPPEQVMHDLLTGDQGQPRLNKSTGKPYTVAEAYQAVKQTEQETKPERNVNKAEDLRRRIGEAYEKKDAATVKTLQEELKAIDPEGEQRLQIQMNGQGNKNTARGDRSYQYHSDKLDKLGKPVEDALMRMGRLQETLRQGTPQADALVAPELLTVMAGGQGSGLRMNEAEIARIVGGRSKWQTLKANIQQWSLDPSKANSITKEQRQQIHGLVEAVHNKLLMKQKLLDEARDRLLDADDPQQHRKILNEAHHKLTAVDEAAAEQGLRFREGQDEYNIPAEKKEAFLKKHPHAQPVQ